MRNNIQDTPDGELTLLQAMLKGAELLAISPRDESSSYGTGVLEHPSEGATHHTHHNVSGSLIARLVSQRKLVRHCDVCDVLELTDSPVFLDAIRTG